MLTPFHFQLIREFQLQNVEFVLIGGHAALLYGSERTTGDMDLLVNPTKENGERIICAFGNLGLEIGDLKPEDFNEKLVLSFGFEPDGVDIITRLKHADYQFISEHAQVFELAENVKISVIDARDLLNEKKQLNRKGKKGFSDQIDILGISQYLNINRK